MGTKTGNRTLGRVMDTATADEIIDEALAVIDRGLAQLMQRELVSTIEAADLLLDVRSLLASATEPGDIPSVPVGN